MKELTPPEILKIITSNTNKVVALGEKIKGQRLYLIEKQAALYDAENEARTEIFEEKIELQVSKLRDYIKWKTNRAEKEYMNEKMQLRQLISEKDILIEVINTAKLSYRIMEMEAKSLGYQSYPSN
jgi:hypothetical protein